MDHRTQHPTHIQQFNHTSHSHQCCHTHEDRLRRFRHIHARKSNFPMALCSHENFIRCYCVHMSVACLLELSRPSTGTTKVSDSPVCTSCYFPVVDFFDSVPLFIFSITGLRFSPLSSDHQPCLSHCCTVLPRHCQPRMPTPILNCPRFLRL